MKKGQLATFRIIILILVVGLILISFAVYFGNNIQKSTRGDDCNRAIILKTMTTVSTAGGLMKYEGTSASCPIYEVKIGKDKTVIYKKQKKFQTIKYPDKKLTAEEIYHIFAEEMRYCWKEYGAGQIDAFWYPPIIFGIMGTTAYSFRGCRACSTITFEDDVPPASYTGLYDYLKTTEFLSKNRVNEGESAEGIQTYYQYLAEKDRYCNEFYQGGENCWEEYSAKHYYLGLTKTEINTKRTYNIVFVRENLKEEEGTLNTYVMNENQIRSCDMMLPYSG